MAITDNKHNDKRDTIKPIGKVLAIAKIHAVQPEVFLRLYPCVNISHSSCLTACLTVHA